MLYLLFNQEHAFLGEVTSRDGSLAQCFLSEIGEREIGSLVERWQTEGLPMGNDRFVVPRSDAFAETLPLWVLDQGLRLVALPLSLIRHWECVAEARVEERIRYELVVELTDQAPDLSAWEEHVKEVRRPAPLAKKSLLKKQEKKRTVSHKKKK